MVSSSSLKPEEKDVSFKLCGKDSCIDVLATLKTRVLELGPYRTYTCTCKFIKNCDNNKNSTNRPNNSNTVTD